MDLENLKTFCVVAQYKSFKKAADILMVTQPGVSRRIQSLEDELGVPLFLRTPQSVMLTKQGQEFLPYAERTVQIMKEGTSMVIATTKEEKLVIAGSPTTCFNLLPAIIKEFHSQYDCSLSVYTATSQQVYDMLVDQTVDIGFTTAMFPNSLLKYDQVYNEDVVCVAAPQLAEQYIENNMMIKHPIPFVCNNLKTSPWDRIKQDLLNNPLFDFAIEANNLTAAERLARIGLGFALLPASDAREGLETGELVKITLPQMTFPKRPVYMVTYQKQQMKDSVKKFKKTVKHFLSVSQPK